LTNGLRFIKRFRGARGIAAFPWQDIPHATGRILYVAFVPGNDVDVKMLDGLPSGRALVHADVESVRMVSRFQPVNHTHCETVEILYLFFGQFFERDNVVLWNEKRVTRADRVLVHPSKSTILGEQKIPFLSVSAKRTGFSL